MKGKKKSRGLRRKAKKDRRRRNTEHVTPNISLSCDVASKTILKYPNDGKSTFDNIIFLTRVQQPTCLLKKKPGFKKIFSEAVTRFTTRFASLIGCFLVPWLSSQAFSFYSAKEWSCFEIINIKKYVILGHVKCM